MQQILDRSPDPLAQSFASLARNARRQQQLYYATVALLAMLVIVSALALIGFAVERHLDIRRSHVAQYVSAISLQLQSEASFLRRTALTIRYYQSAPNDAVPDEDLLAQAQRTGVALSQDGQYVLLVPEATRRAWGDTLPRRLWQLQQIAMAMRTTQTAFDLDHRAYVVDPDAAYAIVLPAAPMSSDTNAALRPELVPMLRDALMQQWQTDHGSAALAPENPRWIGPVADPFGQSRAMVAVMAAGKTPGTLVAASVPANAFLERLKRPPLPATLWLLNSANMPIDISPPADAITSAGVLRQARTMPPESLGLTTSGLLLVQPLRAGFGSLVYHLSYGTLLSAISFKVTVILGLGTMLILGIVLAARYWDVHLLRRSHAEAARSLENETIHHILVSATPIGLCVVRQRDHCILAANAVADALLGCGQGATLPPHIVEALPRQYESSDAHPLAAIDQITVPVRPDIAAVNAPPRPGGSAAARQFLQITYAPARHRDEAVLFCAVQDATAQHQLEHQLRSAREAAEAMMRARSNFFASMSHEIRTPLNALLGNLELLARAEGLEAHASRLRALQLASDGLRRIVNDILDFSKIDAGEMKLISETFRPIDEFENLAMSYSTMVASRPIRFYAYLSPTLDAPMIGDRTRIAQIVSNLLSNAFKFTSSGKISLGAEIAKDAQGGSLLICRVRDSGSGMPQALVTRIFHPFVQGGTSSSARHGGTGLGLSICARLTELMAGQITVESVEGVGSAFALVIPLAAAPNLAAPTTAPVRGHHAAILCPEAESGATLQARLQSAGWRTDAIRGLHAMHAWLRNNRPHIIAASGEYDLAALTSLRKVHPCNVLWITPDGPERAARRAPGIFEVSAFSHVAMLFGALAALEDDTRPRHTSPADAAGPTVDADGSESNDATHRSSPAIAPAPLLASPNADLVTKRGTILVAEDNALNQTLVAEQLDALGWRAIVVGDGQQALSILERGGIDMVLTDIHMPTMDGYDLLDAIRARHPDMPVLAFSAVTHGGQAGDWRSRGFTAHVPKPASLKLLDLALRAIPPRGESGKPCPGNSILPAADLPRYRAMLREHLREDAPRLADIVQRHDGAELAQWAHRSAGAFQIVNASEIVQLCSDIEARCLSEPEWTPDMALAAERLLTAIQQFASTS